MLFSLGRGQEGLCLCNFLLAVCTETVLKICGNGFEFLSSGLQAKQADAVAEMCSSKRVYVTEKLFRSNF